MLIKTLSRVALSSALIFAFSACGSDDSGTDFDDSATTVDTEDMADGAADAASQAADEMNFGGPNIFLAASASIAGFTAKYPVATRPFGGQAFTGRITVPGVLGARGAGLQASASVGCTVEGHGADGSDPFEPYDGNENGIPDDWALKMVCVSKDSSDTANVVTQSTTMEMAAKENAAALHGFDASMNYIIRYSNEEGDAEGLEFHGTDHLDIRSGSAAHKYAFKVREYGTSEGETEEYNEGRDWDASFDPDGTIALGDPLPDGDLDFTGKAWAWATGDIALSFTLDTPTVLAYSAACWDVNDNPPFTSGVIRGRLNGNSNSASFTVTMNDCGNYTVETDNTDDPVVSAHP